MQYYSKDTAPDHVFDSQEPAGRIFQDDRHHHAPRCRQPLELPPREVNCWADVDQASAAHIFRCLGRSLAYWRITQHYYRGLRYGEGTARHAEGAFFGILGQFRAYRDNLSKEALRVAGKAIRQEIADLKKSPLFR
jgi:hypothetical protein